MRNMCKRRTRKRNKLKPSCEHKFTRITSVFLVSRGRVARTKRNCDTIVLQGPWRTVTARYYEDMTNHDTTDLTRSTWPYEPKVACETKRHLAKRMGSWNNQPPRDTINDPTSPNKDRRWHRARYTNKCHVDQRHVIRCHVRYGRHVSYIKSKQIVTGVWRLGFNAIFEHMHRLSPNHTNAKVFGPPLMTTQTFDQNPKILL